MRKRVKGRTFSRSASVRKAFMHSLARAVIVHGKIQTTEARAKEVSMLVEQLITRAKAGDLLARRMLVKYMEPTVAKKLMEEIAPRYEKRNGGYTRIRKIGPRKSDGAPMAYIELV